MTAFGEPQTITVAELAPGDFVVAIPSYGGIRGCRPNSGVRTISAPAADRWTANPGYGRRRYPVESRIITFLSEPAGVNYPCTTPVIVRRPDQSPGALAQAAYEAAIDPSLTPAQAKAAATAAAAAYRSQP